MRDAEIFLNIRLLIILQNMISKSSQLVSSKQFSRLLSINLSRKSFSTDLNWDGSWMWEGENVQNYFLAICFIRRMNFLFIISFHTQVIFEALIYGSSLGMNIYWSVWDAYFSVLAKLFSVYSFGNKTEEVNISSLDSQKIKKSSNSSSCSRNILESRNGSWVESIF